MAYYTKEESEELKIKLPNCVKNCAPCVCFDSIELEPFEFYNPENPEHYITFHLKWLSAYQGEIYKHVNKDHIYGSSSFEFATAAVLRKALRHHSETIDLFEKTYLKTQVGDKILVLTPTNKFLCSKYISSIGRLLSTHLDVIHVFTKPSTPIPISVIIDCVNVHIFTLQIFSNFLTYGRNELGPTFEWVGDNQFHTPITLCRMGQLSEGTD